MRHIQIFEEFKHDTYPVFVKESITTNEIKLMEIKSKTKVVKTSEGYFLCYNLIVKMDNGYWLVNNRIQCVSIQEMIKYCMENSKAVSDWFEILLNTMTRKDDKYKIIYQIDGKDFIHQGKDIKEKDMMRFWLIDHDIRKVLKDKYGLFKTESIKLLMKDLLEKHLNLDKISTYYNRG